MVVNALWEGLAARTPAWRIAVSGAFGSVAPWAASPWLAPQWWVALAALSLLGAGFAVALAATRRRYLAAPLVFAPVAVRDVDSGIVRLRAWLGVGRRVRCRAVAAAWVDGSGTQTTVSARPIADELVGPFALLVEAGPPGARLVVTLSVTDVAGRAYAARVELGPEAIVAGRFSGGVDWRRGRLVLRPDQYAAVAVGGP